MFEKIIAYSLENKLLVILAIFALILGGIYSMQNLAIDAVPDITNNQVQVVTTSPQLAAEEVEKYITLPIEMSMANIPNVDEIRSISRYGLSVITIVFKEKVDIMLARQFVNEQLSIVKNEIPSSFGNPEMMPITTGLGEIYQYVLKVNPAFQNKYSLIDLREIQDWIVKRQLSGIEGIIEVSSFGGYVKEYEVGVIPEKLLSHQISILDIQAALEKNNNNSGGSYIENNENAFYIKTEGRAESLSDIEDIIIKNNGAPIRIKDVANVSYGYPQRYGAMTMDGEGEVVGGITLMFKGANSYATNKLVKERIKEVQKSLPEGVEIYPYLDRSVLVGKTIKTVSKNLIEGGLIVIFVLILLLGNFRAGLIVSSVIPLSMLFAFILMKAFGVSANLMSLGAIDFGIVVDGAVIIVEGILHSLHLNFKGQKLSSVEFDKEIQRSSSKIYRSAAFGVLIILIVFFPIFALEGVEGKTFKPMAQTVSFALIGSLLLSITYVPVVSSLFLKKEISDKANFSDKIISFLKKLYKPLLSKSLQHPIKIFTTIVVAFILSIMLFTTLGSEFIPTLEEGDLAMQMTIPSGSSLKKSIATSTRAEQILLDNFEEVINVVSKIGTAEVPTDPMAIEDADIMILLKEKGDWKNADSRQELIEQMKEKLAVIPDASFEFTQPIQLRFNELMTGAKTDISLQVFGEDNVLLKEIADNIAEKIKDVEGVGDIKVEQTDGLKQLKIVIDRKALAIQKVNVEDINTAIEAAYGGLKTGVIYENERYFNLVVRLNKTSIENLSLQKLFVKNSEGNLVSLSQLASVENTLTPMQISREDAKRRITVGVNVRDRDVASLVADIKTVVDEQVKLPSGYTIKYGGQFENLENAVKRLKIVIPIALFIIILLLYIAFNSLKEAIIIFMAVPFASIGGILALWFRDMPFSISAGIGFIALFGVAVLNGIVLINEIVLQRKTNTQLDLKSIVFQSTLSRLRPVLITALVASLGFLPMALATSNGAEVQRPLATVVIGGLITSTLLTLLVLPTFYLWTSNKLKVSKSVTVFIFGVLFFSNASAQEMDVNLNALLNAAKQNNKAFSINDLEQKLWQNEYKNPFQLQATQFQVQYGQNDGVNNDVFFNVMQNFGAPWMIKRKRNLAETGMELTSHKNKMLENEIDYLVKSLYYEWLYYQTAHKTFDKLSRLMKKNQEVVQLKYEVGEISFSNYLIIKQLLNTILQKQQTFYAFKTKKEQELKSISGIEATLKDTTMHELDFRLDKSMNESFIHFNDITSKKQEQQLKVLKSNYQPTVQAGYFYQSLGKIQGFQGALFGLNVPLVLSGKKYETQKLKINQKIQKIENDFTIEKYENEIEALEKNLSYYLSNPLFIDNYYLNETQTALQQLDNQLNNGYIDFVDYVKSANILTEGLITQFENINTKNQAILKYTFLTKEN